MTVPSKRDAPLLPAFNLDRRRWLNTGLASTVALSQAFNTGCSSEVERTFEYLQDVRLNDGKIVTLRFKDVILARGKDTDKYVRLLKQEMWCEPLGIYYLDEPWDISGAHLLRSFDIVNGVPMLVQIAHHKDMERAQGTKVCELNYLKWLANSWIEVLEPDFPLHIVLYNLTQPDYARSNSKTLQKYGILDFPGGRGDERISMLQHSRGSFCHAPPPRNQNQNQIQIQEKTK
jgi:hypothetical protein